jgi:micrococcal nuclease
MKKLLFTFVLMISLSLPSWALDSAKVLYVVDGDTLKIFYHHKVESIRLLGIDCPETHINHRIFAQAKHQKLSVGDLLAEGKIAKYYVKSRVHRGDIIYVEGDSEPRDKYGRVLGYVFLSDGKMLNEDLLKRGYADLYIIRLLKYKNMLIDAHEIAERNGYGFYHK